MDSRVYGNWSDNSTLPQVQWKHQLVNNISVLDPFTKTWTHAQWVPLSYIISAFSWVSPAGSVQLPRLACLILQLKCPTLLHRHPCLNETRFQNFLLKWKVMVETTSIISKTYLKATQSLVPLGRTDVPHHSWLNSCSGLISIQSTNLLFSLRSHSPSGINQSYFLHPQFLLLNWNGSILIHSPYLTVFLLHNKHFSKPTFPTSCCQPHSNSTVFINQRTSDTEFKGWPQGSWNSYCINIMFTGGQAFSSGLLSIKVLGGVKYTTLSPLVNGTEEQKL